MSALNRTRKRIINFAKGKGYMTGGERKRKKAAKAKAELFADAQVPDEDDLKRIERRKAARRRGSRADTVLTDVMDQLG